MAENFQQFLSEFDYKKFKLIPHRRFIENHISLLIYCRVTSAKNVPSSLHLRKYVHQVLGGPSGFQLPRLKMWHCLPLSYFLALVSSCYSQKMYWHDTLWRVSKATKLLVLLLSAAIFFFLKKKLPARYIESNYLNLAESIK